MTSDEIERLQVGDVILYGKNSTPRIVREIWGPPSRSRTGYKVYSVVVAIRKCSWTGAASTSIDRHSLRTKCERTGMRVKLDGAADMLFDMELKQPVKGVFEPWLMGCCLGKELPA